MIDVLNTSGGSSPSTDIASVLTDLQAISGSVGRGLSKRNTFSSQVPSIFATVLLCLVAFQKFETLCLVTRVTSSECDCL